MIYKKNRDEFLDEMKRIAKWFHRKDKLKELENDEDGESSDEGNREEVEKGDLVD
jgi:hypothetical protein